MKLRILIVDDHQIIIDGLKTMLNNEPTLDIVGAVQDGTQALTAYAELKPDVVLMDIKMPHKSGIETTKELIAAYPQAKVIGLTMFDDDEYIASMLKAGAKGYLLKNTGKQEMITAIHKVNGGELFFSSEVTQVIMKRMVGGNGNLASPKAASDFKEIPLTKREIEILILIAGENTNQQIADKLFISQRTVHSHRRNLMQKVGVKNTAGLVRYAIEQNLLTP